MTTLAKVAGAIHGLSLAVSYGGPVFAKAGLRPALRKITSKEERRAVKQSAWKNFSKVNVPSHVAFTGSWLVLRTLLARIYLTRETKRLLMTKDVLIAGALLTGVAATIAGKAMEHARPTATPKSGAHSKGGTTAMPEATPKSGREYRKLLRLEKGLGRANMAFLAGAIIISPAIVIGVIRSQRMGFIARLLHR